MKTVTCDAASCGGAGGASEWRKTVNIDAKDREILRALARQLVEHVSHSRYARLAKEWKRHNRLQKGKPMIIILPEVEAWNELLPKTQFQTMSSDARALERMLRQRIYHVEHFRDDTIIDDIVRVPVVHRWTPWGPEPRVHGSRFGDAHLAWAFDPVCNDFGAFLKDLRVPELTIDQAATDRNGDEIQRLFGDILTVRRDTGVWPPWGTMNYLAMMRGLTQLMTDVIDHAAEIHAYMKFMTDATCRLHDEMEAKGLVEMNNGNDIAGTGGCTLTDELPGPGYQGQARWRDCWCTAECQEFESMSPQMLDEFVLPYQARVMERFGLTGYGCCEDLTRKFGVIKKRIPHLRRLSVALRTDIRVAAEEIQDRYVYTRKPNPAPITVAFDADHVRRDLEEMFEVAKDCVLEIMLHNLYTVSGHPERLGFWVDTAQKLAHSQ